MENFTLKSYRLFAAKELEHISPTPDLDVQVLLQYAFRYDKTQLLLFANDHVPQDKLDWLNEAVEKRKSGLPVAYITGSKEFYGYNFFVSPDVLIPKPDTELLVERALDFILKKSKSDKAAPLKICDLCAGSGCIGISVLKSLYASNLADEKLPHITFVDISEPALEIAKKNAAELLPEQTLVDKITFIQSDLFENVEDRFDLILTNPPYIPAAMVDRLLQDGRSEPRLALDGDLEGFTDATTDGTAIIKRIIINSCEHLSLHGTILMETGEYNAIQTADFAREKGFTTKIHTDYEGDYRNVEMTL